MPPKRRRRHKAPRRNAGKAQRALAKRRAKGHRSILEARPIYEERDLARLTLAQEQARGNALEALESTLESIRHKGNRQLLIENFLMELLPDRQAPATPPLRSLILPRG